MTPGPSVLENGPQSQSSVQAGAGANVDTPVDSIGSLCNRHKVSAVKLRTQTQEYLDIDRP